MTQVVISGAALLGCLVLFALLACQAHARSTSVTLLNSSEILPFDLPAQPLGDALDAYSRVTQLSVLLAGERSDYRAPAVQGNLTRKQALAGLLASSGLVAYFVDNRSIVVRPPEADDARKHPAHRALALGQIPGVRAGGRDYSAYVSRVQRVVHDSLCASPRTRPGNYRLPMQLWVNARGQVQRLNLLSTTGNAARDTAITHALKSLSVGQAPSANMPQPILMLLVPVIRQACPAEAGG